jgi:alkanesulfonate monooxygenase SsuD/methylene tetrahydromethanopterin reductase-like flavin-dependent oxidoreductase (luciferase family)/putative sterol carrier protein
MRFGVFYEHQLPRPWDEHSEEKLLSDALEQVELADKVGIDYVWEVEHHFLEEYSHSSAPEVFLAAASQRTKNIRLGHGIVQLPPEVNHPARIAERIATLDLLSGGRVDFGTGEGSSQAELGGFGIDRQVKHEQWEESLDAVTRMLVEDPFAGYDGRWVSMPPRNVLPKPKQKPHPPLWVACSRRETILVAARKGLGALTFAFIEPADAKEWVDEYYSLLASEECVPGGFAVNPNIAVVLPLMCHKDEQTAIDRGLDGGHFFRYSLAHYYIFGNHQPSRTNVWEEFLEKRGDYGLTPEIVHADEQPLTVNLFEQGTGSMRGAIGTPDQIADLLERYEQAGVDQVIFISQAGKNRHEDICESLELFGKKVLPRFAQRRDEREAEKRERLAEACERALARRSPPRQADPGYVITPQGEPRPAQLIAAARRASASASANGKGVVSERMRELGQAALAAFVRGRSDRQLERTIGSGPGMRLLFKGMERSFVPDKAALFSGEIQYELGSNGTQNWVVKIGDGRATAYQGVATDPAVTFRMSVPTFARIAAGEVHPAKAMFQGQLDVKGNFEVAAQLAEMFGQQSLF